MCRFLIRVSLICGSGCGWSFVELQSYGHVFIWIPKLTWPRKDKNIRFGVFRLSRLRFVHCILAWTKISKNCSAVTLFWRPQNTSIDSLRCILACSLNMPLLLAKRFRNIVWWALATHLLTLFIYFIVIRHYNFASWSKKMNWGL